MSLKKVNLSINQLVSAGLFLGYHMSIWNTTSNYFLLGKYNKTNFFNLHYTYNLTKKFIEIVASLFAKKCSIWLVHEKFELFNSCSQLLNLQNAFNEIHFFNKKWCKGALSNYKKIKIVRRKTFPHAIIVPNIQNNTYVINECFIKNIPSFGLTDTVDNIKNVYFCIPSNSRSLRSLFYLYFIVCKTIFYGRNIQTSNFVFSYFSKIKKMRLTYLSTQNFLNKDVLFKKFILTFSQINSIKRLLSFITSKESTNKKTLLKLKLKIVITILIATL